MGLGMILAFVALAHAECPALDPTLEAATAALVDGADPAPAFAAAEASLACAPADKAHLARLWLLHGAALHLAGDASAAEGWFAAAATVDEKVWDERLGPVVRQALDAARHRAPGMLQPTRPVLIDGEKQERFPIPADSGPHALQALDASWARVVLVEPSETLRVEVPAAIPKSKVKKARPAGWAVAGAVALAGAVGCGVGAVLQSDTMAAAPTVSSLEEAWATQQALGGGAIALGALGATGIVLQVALP